ncbi:MAG: hypothetical protein AB7E79_13345 [Rhodospirillaceae bacterium]
MRRLLRLGAGQKKLGYASTLGMSKIGADAPAEERARYYLERAEEVRTIAAMVSDPTARQSLLYQSRVWQRMADRAAGKADSTPL